MMLNECKPSGTVSQLVDSASGIHARHAPYYIRRIRLDKKDPTYAFLKEKGVPCEDEAHRPDSTAVFSFPMKAPEGAVCRNDRTAIEQLELWLKYQRHWCEHKPSVTISVKDEEWMAVGAWVYEHFDEMSGVSFLPFSDHTYQQAPYEDITKEQYEEMVKIMPKEIDWNEMIEIDDNTEGAQQLACVSGQCEI
jgi:ribonucleoside-diphosphate reductase alpha chain